jgi:alkylation response protein AidB-like acyl-CoA dehydrogenase
MRFAPAREQREFASALADLLSDSDVPSVARSWADGDFAPGRKLWTRLSEQGVLALGDAGSGATPVDLVLAFEQLGRFAVPGPYVESAAVLPALGRGGDGTAMATLAAPPWVPYALDAEACDAVYLLEDNTLSSASVTGVVTSLDPARRLAEVTAAEPVGDVDMAAAFDLGALATAAQLLGAGHALLERSVAYAKQRTQFGKPIGAFQAVKHLLADVHVGLEFARPLVHGAAVTLDPRDVSAAKVACGDAACRAARTGLQVHGAIGYTAEYDLALWLVKVRALVNAWGTQREHRDRIRAAL